VHALVRPGALHRRGQFARHIVIDGVENLRAVEDDARDAAIALIKPWTCSE